MTEEIHNAYQMLELPIGANLPQVQKAWREMVQVWHPDRFPNNPDLQRKAEERTKQINNAADILERYLIDGDIPRPRPSAQSQKQETEQRTRQQETAAEDAQSSQTHEQENRQKQTTKPFQEKSLDAKIGGIILIIFAIIFGAIAGYFIGGAMISLPHVLDWMIEAVSGWSFIDGANPWIETFPSKTLIIVPLIVTFLGRIITSAMLAENQREFIDSAEGCFIYTFTGMLYGTIGGIIGSEMGDTGIFIGAVLGACLVVFVLFLEEGK